MNIRYFLIKCFLGITIIILNISCATIQKKNEVVKENNHEDKEMIDKDGNEIISLKYPILFVHGAGFRDKTLGFINYWSRIPKYFSQHGITCYYGGTDAWGSVEWNAELLKNKIIDILQEEKTEKVNIIAHSRGGLEARYLISSLDMDYAIASLTTISTPHHGVKAMNIAVNIPTGLYKFSSFFVNGWFKILGDKDPDFFTSSRQLSEIYAIEFNKNNPDKETVYYQSYAAKMKYFISDINFMILQPFIQKTDGDNDGLCPVESAKWGEFKGIITTQGIFGISHSGVIDTYRINYKGTDIIELYLGMVKELSEKGF
jgi:triacylglycerol lipase